MPAAVPRSKAALSNQTHAFSTALHLGRPSPSFVNLLGACSAALNCALHCGAFGHLLRATMPELSAGDASHSIVASFQDCTFKHDVSGFRMLQSVVVHTCVCARVHVARVHTRCIQVLSWPFVRVGVREGWVRLMHTGLLRHVFLPMRCCCCCCCLAPHMKEPSSAKQ